MIRTTGAAWANTLRDVGEVVNDLAHRVGRAAGKAIKSAGSAITGAATSLLEGGEMMLQGLGDGITGFGKNLAKGKVGEAFNSLIRGADKATFGALRHVGDGLIEAAENWFAAPTYLLPVGGKWLRDRVIPWVGDMVHTGFNTAVKIGRDMARMTPEIVLGMGIDLYQSGKALLQGNVLGALKELGMVALNARARAVGGIVDAGMHRGQGILSIGSTALGIEKPGRRLTAEEEALLRQVYGNSIDYDTVRIKHGGASNLMAPHTVGNTIYIPDKFYQQMHDSSGNLTEFGARLLTHETAHVWQSQNGGGDYIHKSLWNQSIGIVTGGSRNLAYFWRTAVGARAPFDQLNVEQQANLLEELGMASFRDTHGGDNDGRADIGEFNIDQDHDPKTSEPGLTNAEYDFIRAVARHARRGEWS